MVDLNIGLIGHWFDGIRGIQGRRPSREDDSAGAVHPEGPRHSLADHAGRLSPVAHVYGGPWPIGTHGANRSSTAPR